MPLTTQALIIRENNNIGEADRFVTALTRDLGVVRASARGAQRMKSRNASATQLLSYSRLSLIKGREKYIIESAAPLRVFFELRSDIELTTLAQYFCELAGVLAPREEPAEDFLRLLLNALHFLGAEPGKRLPALQVKAVVELRLMTRTGYMPDLSGCAGCGAGTGPTAQPIPLYFQPQEGVLYCAECLRMRSNREIALSPALQAGPSLLAAMRHIAYSPLERCFFFSLGADSLRALSSVTEAFLLAQLNRGFNTLNFYHTLTEH